MDLQREPSLIQFETPTSILVCGPSNCGKTVFVKKILENARLMFKEPPVYILYCYGSVWQHMFDDMKQTVENINFHEGLPTKIELIEIHKDNNGHFICVLDDLMSESANSTCVEQLVCVGSHHLNMTIISLVQNLFQKVKVMRTLSLNTHYFVLYKNYRDSDQIMRFGRQVFPQQSKYFFDVYQKATNLSSFGYLLVDLNSHSNKLYTLRTRIFPGEDTIVYRPSDEETVTAKYIIFKVFIIL